MTGTVLGNVTFALAPSPRYFFLGIFVDFFRMTSYVGMRSMMSKIVPPNELGQSNSVFGLCEAIMPLIFGPIYTMIYKYTIDIFPGTFYFFTVTIKFTGLCLFIWLYLLVKKEKLV
ncbi:hypothetical protein WA026_021367 [Henosepilachna vigintioctopunctata]|uniref:Uncharacterized protein n=1 Tax=Henosepilachna vigintioctopunctata TaxID=420089 RepID=A0AAW1TNN1_9CUCU